MMRRLLASLFFLTLPLGAFSLKTGTNFPDIQFPPIEGGEAVGVSSFAGKKLILHLFASW